MSGKGSLQSQMNILGNSRHDQVISFSSGSDEGLDQPGAYSPRPDLDPPKFVPPSTFTNQRRPPSATAFDTKTKPYTPPDQDFIPAGSPPELAQIFTLISKFKPAPVELTSHFKPFLPELAPAIGSIDAFIKIPRPDGDQDILGLTVIDEPTIGCSNPQILRMQLREKYGLISSDQGDGYIGFIKDFTKDPKALENFLDSYEEISRNRAAPNMTYSYKMPELEELMQGWNSEMLQILESILLPSSEIDLTLEEYAKVICSILDIPVKGNLIESLHMLFSLYLRFADNPHFRPTTATNPSS